MYIMISLNNNIQPVDELRKELSIEYENRRNNVYCEMGA